MKLTLFFVAILAGTFGTAAAQAPGSTTTPLKRSTSAPKTDKNVIIRSGGQGHNSGPDPKGKILVAPTTPAASSPKK
ncbi:hypothetical protein GO988_02100 [Hymenobacter sp. HMF4947]|uniref:Uncharacterized protein n=1 Tax=Hymenobacter ginkgonis TaxID=2682976 RepID=A0A7K1TAA3_9BACT|nr:hypothetical protein [Hymenobacter ginkgonis]MVN75111.1 hypothetical protein [Hymenobacter ginkgonis]